MNSVFLRRCTLLCRGSVAVDGLLWLVLVELVLSIISVGSMVDIVDPDETNKSAEFFFTSFDTVHASIHRGMRYKIRLMLNKVLVLCSSVCLSSSLSRMPV